MVHHRTTPEPRTGEPERNIIMSTSTIDKIVENPATSGPVRAAFLAPETLRADIADAREFDSLEEAALSFHSFGNCSHLNDPDGAVGIVWIGDNHLESEVELRFDANGSDFIDG